MAAHAAHLTHRPRLAAAGAALRSEVALARIGIGVVEVDSQNACGRHSLWATELFYG